MVMFRNPLMRKITFNTVVLRKPLCNDELFQWQGTEV